MTEVEKLLANDTFRTLVGRRMDEWRDGKCSIPSAWIDLHEKAAKADIPRLMRETGCTYQSFTWYTYGDKDPHMKFIRIFADDKNGDVIDFRWSDGNGGGWHWHDKTRGGISRNEPPVSHRVPYLTARE